MTDRQVPWELHRQSLWGGYEQKDAFLGFGSTWVGTHMPACTHTHTHSPPLLSDAMLIISQKMLTAAISGLAVLDFSSIPEPWVSSSGPQCLVSTAPLTSRAVPCQALCQTARRGWEGSQWFQTSWQPGRLPEGAAAPGQGSSQGPSEARAIESSTLACACLHFHLGSVSPLNGHGGAAEERPPPVQTGSTCTSQPVSPVRLWKAALLSILAAVRFPLCLPLDVLFKRPLIPGTQ